MNLDQLPRALVPRVISLVGPAEMCNLWRSYWPSGYLGTKGFIADWSSYEDFGRSVPLIQSGRYNMIVTPRIAFATDKLYTEWRDVIHSADLAWVYDTDDDLFSPEYVDRQVRVWAGREGAHPRARYEAERVQRIYLINRVDGVTVTTPRLAEVVKTHTQSPVHVVPNGINADAFMQVRRMSKRQIPPLTIGWSGTLRDDADLIPVARAWSVIAAKYPDVRFIVHGFDSPSLYASVPSERLTILPANTPEQQPATLINFDIVCCAVSGDEWNLAKTPIKWYEATLAGASCVVSDPVYGTVVRECMGGLVANSPEEWVDALVRLIESESLRRHLQHNANLVVTQRYSIEALWPTWIQAWSAILQKRATLQERQFAHATPT